MAEVARLLATGPSTVEALRREAPGLSLPHLRATLDGLVRAGVVMEIPPGLAPGAVVRWHGVGVSVEVAAGLVGRAEVHAENPVAGGLLGALADWSLVSPSRRDPAAGPPCVTVVVACGPDEPDLWAEAGVPVMVVVPTADGALVAAVAAGDDRAALHRAVAASRVVASARGAAPLQAATTRRVAEWAARSAAGRPSPAWGAVVRLVDGEMTASHPLASTPRFVPMRWEDVHPLDRWAPPSPSPLALLDAVTGVAHSPRLVGRVGPAVAMTVRLGVWTPARGVDDLKARATRAAGGKGWSWAEAVASAIWEAAERLSAERHVERPTRTASARDLGDAAWLPADLDLFSDRQRASPSDPRPEFRRPCPLDPERPIEWVRAWPLDASLPPRWIPAAQVLFGYDDDEHAYALAHSNGTAGGPCYEAAALGALLEVVERDAVAVFHYSRTRRPSVSRRVSRSPRIAAVRDALASRDRELWVLDLTHDLRVPVCAAVSRRSSGAPGWTIGFGASLDGREAAERAVLEVVQTLAATDSATHPTPLPWADDEAAGAHLIPAPWAVRTEPDTPAGPPLGDLAGRLGRAGFRPHLVDLTHPLVGVPTVKAVVPGLLFFWRRFGGGRIGRLPVTLGWRPDEVVERDYNPHDLPL